VPMVAALAARVDDDTAVRQFLIPSYRLFQTAPQRCLCVVTRPLVVCVVRPTGSFEYAAVGRKCVPSPGSSTNPG
jgi:hypothetical protein